MTAAKAVLSQQVESAWRLPFDEHQLMFTLFEHNIGRAQRQSYANRLRLLRRWKPRVINHERGAVNLTPLKLTRRGVNLGTPDFNSSKSNTLFGADPTETAQNVIRLPKNEQQALIDLAVAHYTPNIQDLARFLLALWPNVDHSAISLSKVQATFGSLCHLAIDNKEQLDFAVLAELKSIYDELVPQDTGLYDRWIQVLCTYEQRELLDSILCETEQPLTAETCNLYVQRMVVPEMESKYNIHDAHKLSYKERTKTVKKVRKELESRIYHLKMFQNMTPTMFLFLIKSCCDSIDSVFSVIHMLDTYSDYRGQVWASEACQLALLQTVYDLSAKDPVLTSAYIFGLLERLDKWLPEGAAQLSSGLYGWSIVALANLGNARGICRLALLISEAQIQLPEKDWEKVMQLVPTIDQKPYVSERWPAIDIQQVYNVLETINPSRA